MSFRMDFYLWALLLLVQGPGTGAAFLPSSVVRQKQGFYASKPALDVAGPSSAGAREYSPVSLGMSELSDLPSILSSVETFDGSTVDPVVVSNVFWGALQGKIISVIIGQFLAAAVFAVLSSMAASQLAKIGEYVKDNIFKQSTRDAAGATVAQFASSVVDKGKSPTVEPDFGKLLLCIVIDTIGTSSELIPIIGEVTDVAWAPIAGLGLRSLFGSNILFALEFTEEILPFTDILPLATLCWVVDTYYGDSNVAKALGIGAFGNGGTVIDVQGDALPDKKLLTDSNSFDRINK
uniref:H(+)-exporting diphosphatase n=1 Tax=Odontella aurita TaxID=265563 RepID=A0A7S4JJ29_9STRA|mmetsp:Transcript_47238/g.143036  ORF Transcript_47238/g.143036 Transcript_47238/m.143036 type:complete len:293 (+) Transcript_47238:185-1063(+)